MKNRPAALACLLVVPFLSVTSLTLASEPAAEPPPQVQIVGNVVDPEGNPIAGATVRIVSSTTRKRTPVLSETGEDGKFVATELDGQSFWLHFDAEGYGPRIQTDVEANGSVAVQLGRGHRILGWVVDSETSEALPGATVRGCDRRTSLFGRDACREVVADGDGNFVLDDLAEGINAFSAVATDHEKKTIASISVPPAVNPETGRAEPLVIALGPGGRIAGRVVDEHGGPVAGVRIRLAAKATNMREMMGGRSSIGSKTDEAGEFEIEGVPAGARYVAHLTVEGRAAREEGPWTVEKGTDLSDLVLRLTTGGIVTLRIVDPDGNPGGRLSVTQMAEREDGGRPRYVHLDEWQIEERDDGNYAITKLAPGTYRFEFKPACCEDVVREGVQLREGEATDLGTIVARPGNWISGTVTDTSDEPIAGVKISVMWEGEEESRFRSTTTGDDGSYRVSGLGESDLDRVAALARGFVKEERTAVATGDDAVDFVLVPTGGAKGRVLHTDGTPSNDFVVEAHLEAGGRQGTRPLWARGPNSQRFWEDSGEFTLGQIEPGVYTILAKAPDAAPVRRTGVRVISAQDTDVGDLTLNEGISLVGQVVAAQDDQPVFGTRVRVTTPSVLPFGFLSGSEAPSAFSGMDGFFRIDGLEAGAVNVLAEHHEYSPREVRLELSAEAPPEPLILRMSRGGELRGTVTDADGQLVEGAPITLTKGGFSMDMETTATGADGQYRFERLPPGSYIATRSANDGGMGDTGMKPVTIEDGETTVLDFSDEEGIVLTGRVLRGDEPLGEARLMFIAGGEQMAASVAIESTTADAEGHFRMRLEEAGTYQVMVSVGQQMAMGQTVELVVPDEPEVHRDIRLRAQGLSGTVSDPGGDPVAEAVVLAVRDGAVGLAGRSQNKTDSSGAYIVESLEPGTYRVTVHGEGFAPAQHYPVVISDGSQILDFRLEEGRLLRGRVVDPQGNGLSDAMILPSITGMPASVSPNGLSVSDRNGSFQLTTPGDGTIDLAVVAGGWAPAFVTGLLPQDDPQAPETLIRVSSGGQIHVHVVGGDGAPVMGVPITVRPLQALAEAFVPLLAQPPIPTDDQGMTTVSLLPPGSYEIGALEADGISPVPVEVREGEVSAVTLTVLRP